MKQPPNFEDFVYRVGGVSLLFLAAILLAKVFFPGHEVTGVVLVGCIVLTALTVDAWRKWTKKIGKKRQKRK